MLLRKLSSVLLILTTCATIFAPTFTMAADTATDNVKQAEQIVDQALQQAQAGKLAEAKQTYDTFTTTWLKIEGGVKQDSGKAYTDIESNMGQVSYSLMQNKQANVVQALQGLHDVGQKFIDGKYPQDAGFKQQNITLSVFIELLKKTKQDVDSNQQQAALQSIATVRQSWLSVEGNVVAQSASVYNDSERDMVTINAMIAAKPMNGQGADQLLNTMIAYLSPLAAKTGYTIWDAALIPIREGLEALLVVAALITFVNKSNAKKGKVWIWSGVAVGMLFSIVLAIIVKLVFSAAAFGSNNSLISGWTGVIAAVMLLYMSYWLHRQSSIKDYNKMLASKSQAAIGTGKLVSLGALAFLAIFREGTEIVLFLVGMVNQISMQNLLIGLGIGIGVLLVIAFLMLFIGVKLPMRPFFMVSSLIVFYLCLKFTGLGVHSLQLAGVMPSTTAPSIPSVNFIALYPSWESTVPQLLMVLFAVVVLFDKYVLSKKREANKAQKTNNNTNNMTA